MHVAVRPYATTGVALLGAGAIALAPVSSSSYPISSAAQHVSSTHVGLVALVNPITAYTNLFTHTAASLTGLANEIAADPLPILRAMLGNGLGDAQILGSALNQAGVALSDQVKALPAALQTTITQLRNGQVSDAIVGAFSTSLSLLLGPALPLIGGVLPIVSNMVANFNDVIQNALPTVLISAALAPLYPINATVSAFAALAQNVADSVSSRDFTSVVEDFVSAPAVLTDAFLNGFPGGPFGFADPAGGLLSGAAVGFGTVENLLQAAKAIAAQLTRPGPPASFHLALPHLVPKASAATVTLAPVVKTAVAAPKKAAAGKASAGHAKTAKGTAGPTHRGTGRSGR